MLSLLSLMFPFSQTLSKNPIITDNVNRKYEEVIEMKKFTKAIGQFFDKSGRYMDAVSASMNPHQVKR